MPRLEYAKELLLANNIEFEVINITTGEIHCRTRQKDELVIYYANTGKIQGRDDIKGPWSLVQYCLNR